MTPRYRLLTASVATATFGMSLATTAFVTYIAIVYTPASNKGPMISSAYLAVTAAISMLVARQAGEIVAGHPRISLLAARVDGMRMTVAMIWAVLAILIAHAQYSSVWQLVAGGSCIALLTALGQINGAARGLLTRKLLGDQDLDKGSSLQQSATTMAQLFGVGAGPAVAVGGGPIVVAALLFSSFTGSFALLILLDRIGRVVHRKLPESGVPGPNSSRSKRLMRNPGIRAVAISAVLVSLGVGSISSLDPYFLQNQLAAPLTWMSVIGIFMSGGLLCGSIAYGFIARAIGRERTLWLCLAVSGASLVTYSMSQGIYAALPILFIFALAGGVAEAAVGPVIMSSVSEEHLPHAFAYLTPLIQLSSLASLMAAGGVAALMRPGTIITIAGAEIGREGVVLMIAGCLVVLGGVAARRNLKGLGHE